jgi:hypothetical protein
MNHRHPSNPNLCLYSESTWEGIPVQTQRGPLIINYLDNIRRVIHHAATEHPRTCVFRCELNFPNNGYESDTTVISRFIQSLKAQIKAQEVRKLREGKRAHHCHLRYVWVKERDGSHIWHYHVALFVNRDAYFTLGTFKPMSQAMVNASLLDNTNMSDRIRMAWASALGLNLENTSGLVHFPKHPVYDLDANDPNFYNQFNEVFHRLSYFAKSETKHFGQWSKNFGSSRS